MRKLLIIISILFTASYVSADTAETFFNYSIGDKVTDVNLNGNFDNIRNVVNGNLDNNNADTSEGFWFVEVLNSLPAAGNQGRVVFLTANNTLYFDTGSAFTSVATYTGSVSQGDVLFGNASNWTRLAKSGTANAYLSNTGASNNPKWIQVDLSSTVVGNLPVTNLNSGTDAQAATVWTGAGTWDSNGIEVFTSDDTFTAPKSTTLVYLTICGGGGGGSGGQSNGNEGGSGGGGGQCAINKPYTVTAEASYTVDIGPGGNGGGAQANGSAGTATLFDSFSVAGGSGGTYNGAGGTGGGNRDAAVATIGTAGTPGGTGGTGGVNTPAAGGGSALADGGAATAGIGTVGTYGSGGAGGKDVGSGTGFAGGAGGGGFVMVMY